MLSSRHRSCSFGRSTFLGLLFGWSFVIRNWRLKSPFHHGLDKSWRFVSCCHLSGIQIAFNRFPFRLGLLETHSLLLRMRTVLDRPFVLESAMSSSPTRIYIAKYHWDNEALKSRSNEGSVSEEANESTNNYSLLEQHLHKKTDNCRMITDALRLRVTAAIAPAKCNRRHICACASRESGKTASTWQKCRSIQFSNFSLGKFLCTLTTRIVLANLTTAELLVNWPRPTV